MTGEEDLDWRVYCFLAQNPDSAPEDLARTIGLDPAATQAALSRLEHRLLVSRHGGRYRVASLGESILRCNLRYARDLPLVFEDGVIRMKKDGEE
jgi:DNA-binding IclR family transcriptional regulator